MPPDRSPAADIQREYTVTARRPVGSAYRQIADILIVFLEQIHRIRRIIDPQQFFLLMPRPIKVVDHIIGVDSSVSSAPNLMPQGNDLRHILFGRLDKHTIASHRASFLPVTLSTFPHPAYHAADFAASAKKAAPVGAAFSFSLGSRITAVRRPLRRPAGLRSR